jgi:hypothetical protein
MQPGLSYPNTSGMSLPVLPWCWRAGALSPPSKANRPSLTVPIPSWRDSLRFLQGGQAFTADSSTNGSRTAIGLVPDHGRGHLALLRAPSVRFHLHRYPSVGEFACCKLSEHAEINGLDCSPERFGVAEAQIHSDEALHELNRKNFSFNSSSYFICGPRLFPKSLIYCELTRLANGRTVAHMCLVESIPRPEFCKLKGVRGHKSRQVNTSASALWTAWEENRPK